MMSPRAIADAYWQTETTRDVEAVLAHYQEDAELVVPEMGHLVGHGEIRKFYEASVERFPILRVQVVGSIENGERGAFEWSSVFINHEGDEYSLNGINMIKVNDGKLASVHVYYDPSQLVEKQR
jgi:ketosteroid isomerase-like protein